MNTTEIISKASSALYKVGFILKKHSPEILVVAGVTGAVTSAVMACKATTKLGNVVDDAKNNINNIHLVSVAMGLKKAEDLGITSEEDIKLIEAIKKRDDMKDYTEKDLRRETAVIYIQIIASFIKLYGPSVILGSLSIVSILAGHNITKKRNVALAAAYATIDKGFKEYRDRVVERFGKEIDKELLYNIKSKEIEEVVTDENGNEMVEKKTVNVADPNLNSSYARFFDEYCNGWSKDPEGNLMFLKVQQSHANDILHTRHYLFLNEVYEMLGIPKTAAGQVVGWVYDEENPIGDNFVDFGIYDDKRNENVRDFVNGREKSILLDFNVDENILGSL